MSEESHKNLLSADKPIDDPKNDVLGYAPFAEHLANSISHMSPPEGIVLSLYGPWGSGKTTLLRFVEHYIQQQPEDKIPLVISFNPWWFSGQEDLTRRFFDQLLITLKKHDKTRALRQSLAKLAKAYGESPLPLANYGKAAGQILEPGTIDIVALKEKVTAVLQEKGFR